MLVQDGNTAAIIFNCPVCSGLWKTLSSRIRYGFIQKRRLVVAEDGEIDYSRHALWYVEDETYPTWWGQPRCRACGGTGQLVTEHLTIPKYHKYIFVDGHWKLHLRNRYRDKPSPCPIGG